MPKSGRMPIILLSMGLLASILLNILSACNPQLPPKNVNVASSLTNQNSQTTTLELCYPKSANSNSQILTRTIRAIVLFKNDNKWEQKGWKELTSSNKCKSINLGSYEGDVYVYGESKGIPLNLKQKKSVTRCLNIDSNLKKPIPVNELPNLENENVSNCPPNQRKKLTTIPVKSNAPSQSFEFQP